MNLEDKVTMAKLEIGIVHIPLVTPFKTALRTVERVDDLLVRITSDDGMVGFGEAPPTKAITGETLESIERTIRENIAPAIALLPETASGAEILSCIQNCCPGNTSAKAAVDIAIYDLLARKKGLPLYRFLGKEKTKGQQTLSTDLTISVNPIQEMVDDAMSAVRRGFRALKIKVGKEGEKDLEKIKAIRDAVGSNVAIRVDANQGWTEGEAVSILNKAQDMGLGIELVEQPVKASDLEGMAYVKAHTKTLIVADESAFHEEDARNIFALDAADLVNIKLMKCGGLYEAEKIARTAGNFGKHVMMGCMLESKISVSAAAHFAASQGDLVLAVDLDGPMLCSEDPYVGGPVYDGPSIVLNETPGLGINEVDPSFLDSWERIL